MLLYHCNSLFLRRGLMVAVLATFTALASPAEGVNGGIAGKIIDQSGRGIPHAVLIIKDIRSANTRSISAAVDGSYSLPKIAQASYQITASAPGFVARVIQVEVTADKGVVLNITLHRSTAGSSRDQTQDIRNIPLNGRSATDVAALEPGVASARTQASAGTAQRGFGTQITISGGRPRQNDSRLDGISVNDYANSPPGSAAGVNLGVDAVQRVSVLSNDYPAQYGRSSGGIVSSSTRSGTSAWHGSAFEFLRNSALDARNFFDIRKPPFKRNQFGGTLGGPLWKDETFIFAAYEGFRQSLGISQVSTVPSADARAGRLSTGQIPVDPRVLAFVNAFYPLPNAQLLPSGDTGIFNFAGQQIIPENYFTMRVDHTASKSEMLSGTYMFDNASVQGPDELNNKKTGYNSHRQLVTVNEVHSSGKLINSIRVGVNRVVANTGLTFASNNAAAASPDFGAIPGRNAPGVNVAGLTSFSGGLGSPSAYNFHWTSIQAYDDASIASGNHVFKFGGGFERDCDNIFAESDPGGVFSFNSLTDFLEDRPFSLAGAIPGSESERGLREGVASLYVQNHWAFRSNLSLDLGLRYEVSTVPGETNNKLTVLRKLTDASPHLGAPLFSNPTLHNFEPRIGFSWNPFNDGKNIISGGFGIFDVLPLPYLVQFNEVNSAPFAESGNATNLAPGTFPNLAFLQFANSTNQLRQAYFEPHPGRSYVMQWNLTWQRKLTKELGTTIAYVGSRGVHQPFRVEDADIVLPAVTAQGYVWPAAGGQRLNPHAGRITAGFWTGDSYFDGLETKLQGHLKGVELETSYTWGKTIDTSSGSIVGDEYANSISSPLFFNPALNRGLADFNIAHNFEANYDWDIGGSKASTRLLKHALQGWHLGGVFSASTGVPFTPGIGGDALGLKSTDPSVDVPDLIAAPGCSSLVNPGNPFNYIKTQCFMFPRPSNQRGDLGRNTLIGPGLMSFDFSIIKNTYVKKISEAFNVQFRMEIFNLLNHANFAPPLDNKNVFDASGLRLANAGLITSTQTPSRQIQFALKMIW